MINAIHWIKYAPNTAIRKPGMPKKRALSWLPAKPMLIPTSMASIIPIMLFIVLIDLSFSTLFKI